MKNKLIGLWLTVVALLLAALALLSFLAGRAGYRNLLLVTPSALGAPGLRPETLEEFSAEEFLLTYEIRQSVMAWAIQSTQPVTQVETNAHYAGIMGYPILHGGFFTQAAMDAKNRHAVLNETAAFQLFGGSRVSGNTFRLNGETWMVVGVIQDGDAENANLYLPASITGGQADSIMVLLDRTVTEVYAKTALKSIGIQEDRTDFVNLSRASDAFGERFSVAWKSALSVTILCFLLAVGGRLPSRLRSYRTRLRELYFRELLVRHRSDLLKTVGGLLLLAAGTGALLALSLQILDTCLRWQELVPITGELAARAFGHKLLWLREYQPLSRALFGTCVCLTLLGPFLALLRPPPRRAYGQAERHPIG